MGQTVSNVGIKSDGPDLLFYHHFGDEGLDDATAITTAQAESLIRDAWVGQAAFDQTAGAIASWYAFPTLTAQQRTAARTKARQGCARWAGVQT